MDGRRQELLSTGFAAQGRPSVFPSLALFEVALFGGWGLELVLHEKQVLSHD